MKTLWSKTPEAPEIEHYYAFAAFAKWDGKEEFEPFVGVVWGRTPEEGVTNLERLAKERYPDIEFKEFGEESWLARYADTGNRRYYAGPKSN